MKILMGKYKVLDVGGALLNKDQLENYLQQLAADQILKNKSDKKTYPIPRLKENLKFIYNVYNILNEDIKYKIPIHPAGEWILDNFYIIEKNAKNIINDLSIKKYVNFVGVANGQYKGFARIYIIAKVIVSYTDGKINGEDLEKFLLSYQNKKNLSMEELWSINTFLQISLIEKIRNICEKIYLSQIQKRKVENLVDKYIEFDENKCIKSKKCYTFDDNTESKYPFIEYLSYKLKKYGKKSFSYIEILEEQVNKTGTTVLECINREHYDIATKKISIGNSITSMNILNRLNFVNIFDKINGVEEILRLDPANVYEKMDYKTKEYYRACIEKISKKTKISELYIAQKCLELAKTSEQINGNESKKSHVGYYLISNGKFELFSELLEKNIKPSNIKIKEKIYIEVISIISVIISCLICGNINLKINKIWISFLSFILIIIPIKNIIIKLIQYISGKFVMPKLVPKLDFSSGIPKEYTSMVIIPTILKNKDDVKKFMRKLEVFYHANKSENLYFTLLGDCCSSKNENEKFDEEIIEQGIEECKKLNNKYYDNIFPKFNFIYRKRKWCKTENCYLGWERKRGLITEFNKYILHEIQNPFLGNTFEDYKKSERKIPKIKYIITLDSDTNLVLNSGLELVGAMAHILNKPILDKNESIVIDGYGIIQPRIGIGLQEKQKSKFTQIFSGIGGTDSYTNAISDFYYDNFDEGIFTGKGIFDLIIFNTMLKNEIPENTVLSHDLLEGCYLRCGLASDIVLMDGYPTTYNSYKKRLHRWIRGDYQIFSWIFNKKINMLSKYKILDNIFRALLNPCIILLLFLNLLIKSKIITIIAITSALIPYIIDLINKILCKKDGQINQKSYSNGLSEFNLIIIKSIIEISLIPDKAFNAIDAGIKSIYRMCKSKKHLLEWTTADEAERMSKNGVLNYYSNMLPNLILGIILLIGGLKINSIIYDIIGILWIIAPIIMNYISKPIIAKKKFDELDKDEKNYVINIAKRTWSYFKENLTIESNFLPPDNYQENRKEKIVYRTSPTNIGLALLSVIASYDLDFETKEDTINLLEKMLLSIEKLPKWNGHLYNWYNIKKMEPLNPKYVSSVDSGNFVGYLYVLKQFLVNENNLLKNRKINNNISNKIKEIQLESKSENKQEKNLKDKSGNRQEEILENMHKNNSEDKSKSRQENNLEKQSKNNYKNNSDNKIKGIEIDSKSENKQEDNLKNKSESELKYIISNEISQESEKISKLINIVDNMINNTDFSKLFDEKNGLFSIGYNIEENKLTDSYYDLLASEARQTSLIAIAKKDIPSKHWKNLSRALTILNGYKGLISWSGTSFEYLMPTINIKRYPNSLIDESCKFMIMSQKEYAKKLEIPWGISEAAFNLKDLHGNYQYKAFGIPWLGLKRGLADEMVVSSYGAILAINDEPKKVINNIKKLEQNGMYNKYGFYESIDYTPSRVERGKKFAIVKTYMAHHQGLILLSIDNLVKNNIFQTRFSKNPEIESVDILLQERMPENVIITKEQKEKIQKIKYVDYDYYSERYFDKKDEDINECNLISNNNYSILIDKNGNGVSYYKDKIINRFKNTEEIEQGIYFFVKDVNNRKIWSPANLSYINKSEKYSATFFPDKDKFSRYDNDIKTELDIIVTPEDPVEIRRLNLKNIGEKNKTFEISSVFEPVISNRNQDYAHKAFNNLFLSFEIEDGIIIAKRNARSENEKDMYLATCLYSENFISKENEYEVDKANLYGRINQKIPILIEKSIQFSKNVNNSVNPVISFRNSVEIKEDSEAVISLIIGVSEIKDEAIKNVKKYMNNENIERAFKLSKAHVEAKTQYLGIHGKDINLYQRILSHILLKYEKNNIHIYQNKLYPNCELWKFGISGDNPIILVEIENLAELDIIKNIVKAFEFYKIQNINIDVIILNNEKESYENYIQEAINEIVWNHNSYAQNKSKIYVLNNLNEGDKNLLKIRSDLILSGKYGNISNQLDEYDYEYLQILKNIKYQNKKYNKENLAENSIESQIYENDFENQNNIIEGNKYGSNFKIDIENLKFYNEYGGFSNDGKKYIFNINKDKKTPVVWSNVIANPTFGTVVTDSLGGYTWYKNSRLNRLTAWNNDQIQDIPSEIIYIKDCNNNYYWTISPNPIEDNNEYYVEHGLGYSKYTHCVDDIYHENYVFVSKNDNAKINIIHLKNLLPEKRKLKLIYYVKPVLDEDEIKSNGYINLKLNENNNVLIANNIINTDFKYYMYITSNEKILSYTGSKKEFLGDGNLTNPDGIKIDKFSEINSLKSNEIIAINFNVEIDALGYKDISITIGAEDNEVLCKDNSYKYNKIDKCYSELNLAKKYWENITNRLYINTPDESFNIIINNWLIYQTLSSRLLGKTGFYQSGGAFGFRDQLQDVMCLKYINPEIEKNQIIKNSEHQFIEGDVLHWWHEENGRGIRTRFSDDLLWLPYVTYDYIKFTNDYNILDIETSYLTGNLLNENENERYDLYLSSEIKEPIYNHCIKAIKKSLNFGENGLPKIGSGDWNDGLSNVGIKGKGESVWLGFFLYDILIKFSELCRFKKDIENEKCFIGTANKLKENLNNNGWDGRWFKRAFCDDGTELGTIHNQECRIDSISQSWSIISNCGEKSKQKIAMESLENHLVDKNNGIIKLLDPPFENGNLNPGYIKSYLPGTRENGGQYTHAAIWAIIAETILGNGNKATELYKMINPIEHTKTKDLVNKYKVEPYVIPADIYGAGNLAGRGGWTWYTGSSSWYYICGIKYILGLNIEDGNLYMNPCINNEWKQYEIKYKYGESIYNIKVKNPNGKNYGISKFIYNGNEIEEKKIKLDDNGKINEVEIIM